MREDEGRGKGREVREGGDEGRGGGYGVSWEMRWAGGGGGGYY